MGWDIILATAIGCALAIVGLYVAYIVIYVLAHIVYLLWVVWVLEPIDVFLYNRRQKTLKKEE